MSLVELAIDDLRCIERAELQLHPGHNLIWGGNGSGKTSLLEGIFLLGRGRSFRTRNSERLIRYGQSRLVVFGRTGAGGTGAAGVSGEVGGFRGGAEAVARGIRGNAGPAAGSGGEAVARGIRGSAGSAAGSGGSGGEPVPRGLWGSAESVGDGSQGDGGAVALRIREQTAARSDAAALARDFVRDAGPSWGSASLPSSQVTGGGLDVSALPEGRDSQLASSPESQELPGLPEDETAAAGGLAAEPWTIQSFLGASTEQVLFGQALGVLVSKTDGTTARISGANAKSLTELTQVFPVQVIDPGIHKLVEEAGHRRRRWMDWAVFHVEHQFGDWWLRYTRALKQRNAALRTYPAQAGVWDSELIRLGELIAAARGRFVEALLPYWKETVLALSGLEPELHYFKGWAQDVSLAEALVGSRVRDESKRLTHPGPHRADVVIRMNGRPAREVLSRGQQKLVAVAMTLAQLHLVKAATQTTPTLLLDDPAAELDGEHLKRFIDQVLRLESQLILTSLQPESHLFGKPDRVFHVEHGRVKPA